MKKVFFKRLAGILYWPFTVCGLLGSCMFVNGGVEGDIDLLRQVALQHRANVSSITTWQGEARMDHLYDDYTDGNRFVKKISFWMDKTDDCMRSRMVYETNTAFTANFPDKTNAVFIKNQLLKKNVYYTFFVDTFSTDKGFRHLSIEPSDKAPKYNAESMFNPTWHMTDFGEDMHDRLMFYHDFASEPTNVSGSITVSRTGNHVVLERQLKDLTTRHVFDLTAGGNRIEYLVESPRQKDHITYTYEQKENIWIPKSRLFTRYKDLKHNTRPIQIKKIIWLTNAVNLKINPSEFSVESLGLKKGDKVSDLRVKKRFEYGITWSETNDYPIAERPQEETLVP